MSAPACQRCGESAQIGSVSYFNTQFCCMPCLDTEQAHIQYGEARAAELLEVSKQNYNYPGLGLPADIPNLDLPRDSRLP